MDVNKIGLWTRKLKMDLSSGDEIIFMYGNLNRLCSVVKRNMCGTKLKEDAGWD